MRFKSAASVFGAIVLTLAVGATACTGRAGGISADARAAAPAAGDHDMTSMPGGGGGGGAAEPSGGAHTQGPAPTAASVTRANGPFRYTSRNVSGPGFASATVYTPQGVSGKVGGIILIPPFLVNNSALAPQAQRYASNGFTVLSLNVRSVMDFPPSRTQQARAALQVLKQQASVDSSRIGVGGYSMGGGATMELITSDPTIKAGVPQVPWNPGQRYARNQVPVFILGGQADTVAPPAQNAQVFFNSISSSVPHGIGIATGASHFIPSTPPAAFTQLSVSWMKYFVDGDTRYKQFITSRPGGLSNFQVVGLN